MDDYKKCMEAAGSVYYADLVNRVCLNDGKHVNLPTFYYSKQDCCSKTFIDSSKCLSYAPPAAISPNPKPTQKPTQKLTPSPTRRPISQNSSPVEPAEKVYYPDLVLGVCKSDGQQGLLPHVFTTAEECCDNNLMDYAVCMTYAAGQMYIPNPVAQYCRVSDGSEMAAYIYDNPEDCCATGWMGEYDACLLLTIESLGGDGPVTASTVYATTTDTTEDDPVHTPLPTSSRPTPKPISQKPTPEPTEKYTLPAVVVSAIDARHLTDEVSDGFEKGINGVWPWSTTPDTPWTIDKINFKEGTASAKSAPISQGVSSDLYVAVNSDHGGTFFFSLKSDVQMPFSGFYVNVDSKSKMGYTFPTTDWRDLSLSVEAGQHVLMFRTWVPSLSASASATSTGTVNIDDVSFVPHLIEDFESDTYAWKQLEFTGGDWIHDTSKAHGGSVSLRSPALSAGEEAVMSFEFTTSTKGSSIEFWYYGDIADRDGFSFMIDGYSVLAVTSSTGAWKMQSKSLVPGTHTIEWKVVKGGQGKTAVWMDDIRIMPMGV